jgi:hypothetical protein
MAKVATAHGDINELICVQNQLVPTLGIFKPPPTAKVIKESE